MLVFKGVSNFTSYKHVINTPYQTQETSPPKARFKNPYPGNGLKSPDSKIAGNPNK